MTIFIRHTHTPINIPDEFVNQMILNERNATNIFNQTPIGKNSKGEYFWWEDEAEFYDLDKESVENLIKTIEEKVQSEQ